MVLKVTESDYENVFAEMVRKQNTEHKEQFATMFANYNYEIGTIEVENIDVWPDYLLEQTETSVSPKKEGWDQWVVPNLILQNVPVLITVHTHPEWYGAAKTDNEDLETFKQLTENFSKGKVKIDGEEINVVAIHGIISNNGHLFYKYNMNSNSFEEAELMVGNQLTVSAHKK